MFVVFGPGGDMPCLPSPMSIGAVGQLSPPLSSIEPHGFEGGSRSQLTSWPASQAGQLVVCFLWQVVCFHCKEMPGQPNKGYSL